MRWPWVSRRTLERAEARHTVERAHLVARTESARWMLDQVLTTMAVFGDDPTGGDPAKIAAAQAHLDQVLTSAVLWRETEQAGGMAGTGYIARRAAALAERLFGGTA